MKTWGEKAWCALWERPWLGWRKMRQAGGKNWILECGREGLKEYGVARPLGEGIK